MTTTLTTPNDNRRGFTLIEILIVLSIISVACGYGFVQFRKGQNQESRSKAAGKLCMSLENARLDSMRRGTRSTDQFAGVTILSAMSYKVSQDSDSDGNLDQAVILSLPSSGLKFSGPFPNTIKFDWLGRPVDSESQIIEYPLLAVTDSSGSTFIKFTNSGKPEVSTNPKY